MNNRTSLKVRRRQQLVFFLFLTILFLLAVLGATIKSSYFDEDTGGPAFTADVPNKEFVSAKKPDREAQKDIYSWQTFVSTAYGPPWDSMQGTGTTSTGLELSGQACIIAVDPKVIPYHSEIVVRPNPHNECPSYKAEDTGGAIVGNHIDFYDWNGRESQMSWGRKTVKLAIID